MRKKFRKKYIGHYDITFLLSVLLVFSFFIGNLHGRIHSISMNAMLSEVHPFIISHSVEKIAAFSKQLAPERAYQLARTIIADWGSELGREDALELLFALSRVHAKKQPMFFNLIAEYPSLFENEIPVAYVAASSGYADMIPALEAWEKAYAKAHNNAPDVITNDTRRAAEYAIDNHKITELEHITEYAQTMKNEDYTTLLWRVVEKKRDARFIPLLVRRGADPRSIRGPYTVLMQGVITNNVPAVKALIGVGADMNRIVDNETGSALQLALINNFVEMEQLLRSHGAHE